MRILAPLALAAAFVAAPAFAQTPPPAPVQTAPAPQSPEEAAIEAEAEAFQARMETMQAELVAAVEAANGDQAKAAADVDAILVRYQPEFDAFAAKLEAFVQGEADKETDPARKAEMLAALPELGNAIRTIPAQIRAGFASEQPAAAPAAQ